MMLLFTLLFLGHVTSVFPYDEQPVLTPIEVEEVTTLLPETAQDETEQLSIRLPKTLKPLHYLVKLQPFVNGNHSIHGYVEIEMEVLEPTSKVILHIADIITKNDTVKIKTSDTTDRNRVRVKKHEYDHERQFYIAHLRSTLEKGRIYVLSMDFEAYLNDQLRGFYRSTYTDEQGIMRTIATTQFQATDARRAFPCFDEPALKATFEIYLARETSMKSIANMDISRTFPVEGQSGWVWDQYKKSVPMSTYLVAFVITDFTYVHSNDSNNVTFRVWAREGAIDQAEYANIIGPKMLTFFEEYFNIAYPLPKQDMIALPDFSAGAMENWGLITYREPFLLHNPKISTPQSKGFVASIVSHELAHQWFGNLVTPEWWDDLWLNEGFATYMAHLGVNAAEPTWKALETSAIQTVHGVFNLDSLESSHRISIPVNHPDEINEIFDGISYEKGASIIRMMSHFLSESTFRKGLSSYLNAFKYSSAVQDDLWEYLTIAAHEDGTLPKSMTVKQIMDTWTLQKGYPVIQVLRSKDGTAAIITQERFLQERSNIPTDNYDYKWWIPITMATQANPDFNQTQAKMWMTNSNKIVSITDLPPKDQWVILNVQETGYYRVNYDERDWKLLIKQLKKDHEVINPINRAQIIDDAMSLARAGYLDYKIAISLYDYLRKESEYLPWSVAVGKLNYLETMFKRKGGYGGLKNYILEIVLPLYEDIGFHDDPTDPYLVQKKRQIAVNWACKMGHSDCLQKVVSKYRQWMNNPEDTSIISPNLKSVIYCRAIAEGGEAEWDFAWNQYLRSDVANEKNNLLNAMGCTRQTWLLSRYLEMAFEPNGNIRQHDISRVLRSIGYNQLGRPLVWDYLTTHWNDIFTYKKRRRGEIMKGLTYIANTGQELQNLEEFLKDASTDLEGNKMSVEQAAEKTRHNVAWMKSNYDVIVQWLDEQGFSSRVKIV